MITIPDSIGARFQSPVAQGLAAVAILVAVVGYMATNLLALGLVIDAIFGLGRGPAIWIGTLIILAYSVSGGILAGIYNDVFQGVLMAAAYGMVFVFALNAGGGMAAISDTIMTHDAALLSPWGKLSPLAALSFYFVFGLGSLGQPPARLEDTPDRDRWSGCPGVRPGRPECHARSAGLERRGHRHVRAWRVRAGRSTAGLLHPPSRRCDHPLAGASRAALNRSWHGARVVSMAPVA